VAEIFRARGQSYRASHVLTPEQGKAMRAIEACRTATLGGHTDACDTCGFERPAYNSCRNRHCPKCQGGAQAAWVEKHMARVLPTHYFHVVFTLPAELRPLVHRNRRLLFELLFETAVQTLLTFAKDRLGATLGLSAILHTWARDLGFHPHVHIIVTGGGLALDQASWVSAEEDYLFPYLPLSRLFRGKFMAGLTSAYRRGVLDLAGDCDCLADQDVFDAFKDRLYGKQWVVYQKPPFGGPRDVYRYLGRYTHRIAISNHRILELDETSVRFKTKHGRTVTLRHEEFIRRFLLHVLPKGFVKIRHYGLMATRSKARHERASALLEAAAPVASEDPPRNGAPEIASPMPDPRVSDNRCPACLTGTLVARPLLAGAGRPPPRDSRS
jgi:hypothetical protein